MASAFVGFLAGLPPRQIDQLYESPWACMAVVRSLPPLAKQFAMRLLYVETAVEPSVLVAWMKSGFESKHRVAVERMRQLRLLVEVGDETEVIDLSRDGVDNGRRLKLNPVFQRHLREVLESGFATGDRAESAEQVLAKVPPREQLDEYAKGRWETLLLTLTGASDAFTGGQGGRRLDVSALFRAAGLVSDRSTGRNADGAAGVPAGGSGGRLEGVTAAGFRFLLTSAQEQIWLLLTQYIDSAVSSGGDAPTVISFLLRLTFQQPGVPYPSDGMSPTQQQVIGDLAHLGLLYTLTVGAGAYYVPTYLSAGMSSGIAGEDTVGGAAKGGGAGTGGGAGGSTAGGHIIVETNYRVYAYTSSATEMEILRLFTRPDYRLPNLYVGMLTRETVHNALASGISAEQIVEYLRKHAHPHVRATPGPAVPPTVCDQIRLWARARTRLKDAPAVLYCDFPMDPADSQYSRVVAAAHRRGVVLWEDEVNRRLAVTQDAHPVMKEVFKRIKAGERDV